MPVEYKIEKIDMRSRAQRGKGLVIEYDFIQSKYGHVLMGRSPYGVCWLGFDARYDLSKIQNFFPRAQFVKADLAQFGDIIDRIIDGQGEGPLVMLPLHLCGTEMQVNVWKALLNITRGQTSTYGKIAEIVNKPTAFRAVGSAVGANPLSIIIPCHRVLGAGGNVNHYAWGTDLKRSLLADEGIVLQA